MNATPSVAAPAAPTANAGAASGANAAPAEGSAIGEFAAMLEALAGLPVPTTAVADAAEVVSDAAAGEEPGAPEAAGENGLAALATGWPWLGLTAAAPDVPAAGKTAMAPDVDAASAGVSSAEGSSSGRPGPPNIATATAFQAASVPDLAPRGKAAAAATADATLPAVFAPAQESTARAEAPASLTDTGSAIAPTAAAVSPSLSPATHASPVHQAALPSRPGEPAFAADLAAELRVMVEGGLQEAELSLHPAELGPIQVQLRVHGGSADISLAAANGFTRDGLAQALPELREMLASQGLQLGQAGVDAGRDGRGFGDAQQRQQGDAQGGRNPSGSSRGSDVAPAVPRRVAVRSLLDLYA